MTPRTGIWVMIAASAALSLSAPAFSQGRGTTTAPTTGTSTGTIPTTGSTGATTTKLPTGTTTPTTNPTNQRPAVLFVTGRVMLEEGGPPPDTVSIERVCNSSARAEGYTDSKGYFSLEIGDDKGVFQDASETATYGALNPMNGIASGTGTSGVGAATGAASTTTNLRYSNCELRAKLPGYRSQTVSLANRQPMDDPNIGTILLHREGKDEGSVISAVSLAAPHDAKRAFDKARQAEKKGKTDEAEKEYQKAVELYPHYADAWNELGHIQLMRKQFDFARHSFETAIQSDPKYVNPYLQLSLIQMDTKSWRALADTTAKALKLDPFDYPMAYLYNGVANWNLRDFETAEKSIREAERLDGQHQLPDVSRLLGMILMHRREYAGAVEQMRLYLKLAPDSEEAPKVRAELAQAEKLVAQNASTAADKH